jgi:hypothetical protein
MSRRDRQRQPSQPASTRAETIHLRVLSQVADPQTGRADRGTRLMEVQLDFMGVQLGGKVIWAG